MDTGAAKIIQPIVWAQEVPSQVVETLAVTADHGVNNHVEIEVWRTQKWIPTLPEESRKVFLSKSVTEPQEPQGKDGDIHL